jgi:hypothetical protein
VKDRHSVNSLHLRHPCKPEGKQTYIPSGKWMKVTSQKKNISEKKKEMIILNNKYGNAIHIKIKVARYW